MNINVSLSVVGGSDKGKEYIFDRQDVFILGRAADCTHVIKNDATFSRHHLLLEINQDNISLADLGSLNGTCINGKKIGGRQKGVSMEQAIQSKPIMLKDEDIISAGKYRFKVSIDISLQCCKCGRQVENEKETAKTLDRQYICQSCTSKKQQEMQMLEEDDMLCITQEQKEKADEDAAEVVAEIIDKYFKTKKNKNEPLIIARYKDVKEIGRGGFGAVYKAKKISSDMTVAVKTMLKTNKVQDFQRHMFQREIALAIQLMHKNLINTLNGSVKGDIFFIEMEYANGGCVYDLMNKGESALGLNRSVPIMMDVLSGMAYAHTAEIEVDTIKGNEIYKGVVHRDMKPQNILLFNEGRNQIAKVADFGLAKAFAAAGLTKQAITRSFGNYCGSYGYMAKEHVVNYKFVKPTTDVFETAATFFHMITGYLVWPIDTGKNLISVILEEKTLRLADYCKEAPQRLCEIFDVALNPIPEKRFSDCGEFLKEMEKVL